MKLTLNDVGNLGGNPNSAQNTINENSRRTSEALENTLSRDGRTPNEMRSDLDMNHYRVLNLPPPLTANEAARWADLVDGVQTTDAVLPPVAGGPDHFLTSDGTNWIWGEVQNFGEYIIPEGLVNDGTTDNRAAIQNALDTGKNVLLPRGSYAVRDGLYLKNHGQWLRGAGAYQTALVPLGSFPSAVITVSNNLLGCKVSDFDFNAVGQTTSALIAVIDADRTWLERLTSHGAVAGIYIRHCNLVTIRDQWHNSIRGAYAFYLDGGDEVRSDVIVFHNVTASADPLVTPTNRFVGLNWVGNVHTVAVQGMRFIQPSRGIVTSAGNGTYPSTTPSFFQGDDVEVDFPHFECLYLDNMYGFWLNNGYLCNSQASDGVSIFDTSGMGGLTNCTIRAHRRHGVYINGQDWMFSNCRMSLNSWGQFGVGSGVFCDLNSRHVSFSGCESGAEEGSGATQLYGIYTALGSQEISWTGGYLGGNLAQPWRDASGLSNNTLEIVGASGSPSSRVNEVQFSINDGYGATAAPVLSTGAISGVTLLDPGSGYLTPPNVIAHDPHGTGTGATLTATISEGRVTGVTVNSGGTGYSTDTVLLIHAAAVTPPTIRAYSNTQTNIDFRIFGKGTGSVAIGNDLGPTVRVGEHFVFVDGLVNAGSDGAAGSAGVPLNGLYRQGNQLRIRVS